MEIPSGRAGHGQPGGPGWPQYRGEDECARRDAVSTVTHLHPFQSSDMFGYFFLALLFGTFFPPGILLVASLTFFALLFKPLLALLTSACCSFTYASLNGFFHFTLTFFFPCLRPSPINCSSSSSASELQQRWILLSIPSLKYTSVF